MPRTTRFQNIPSHLIASHVAPHLSTRTSARLDAAVPGLHHDLGHAMKTIHEKRLDRSRAHLGKAVSRIADRIIAALGRTSPEGEETFVEGRFRIVVWKGWHVTFVDTTTREPWGIMTTKPITEANAPPRGHLVVYVRDPRKMTVPEKARRGFFVGIAKDILKKLYGKPVEMVDTTIIGEARRVAATGKTVITLDVWPFFQFQHGPPPHAPPPHAPAPPPHVPAPPPHAPVPPPHAPVNVHGIRTQMAGIHTQAELHRAYKRHALKLHPNKHAPEHRQAAQAHFQALGEAYAARKAELARHAT